MLSNVVSIFALLLAIISLGFTFFQFHRSQSIGKLRKVNEVLTFAFRLRSKSQELRDYVGRTDDIDELDNILDPTDLFAEEVVSKALSNPKVKISEIYKMEEKLLSLDLELDLLRKQVEEHSRFNKEVAEFEKSN